MVLCLNKITPPEFWCAVLSYFTTLLVTRIGLRRETDVLHDVVPNLEQN